MDKVSGEPPTRLVKLSGGPLSRLVEAPVRLPESHESDEEEERAETPNDAVKRSQGYVP